jgi:hypothetical protein
MFTKQVSGAPCTAAAPIFGGWQGYPYVWEFEKNEAFRFAVERFGLAEAEAAAFAWAERELRPSAPS